MEKTRIQGNDPIKKLILQIARLSKQNIVIY